MIRPVAVLVTVAVAGVALTASPAAAPAPGAFVPVARAVPADQPVDDAAALPLAGVRIALDPGHQLGNHRFPAKIGRLVFAGGFMKPCNTTGTATNSGYPEASLTFAIVRSVRARLEALGATVLLTRTVNSNKVWGPCVDARGKFGARVHADLTVSVHADGAPAAAHGFHVITPRLRAPWTTDIAAASRELALALRSGFDAQGIRRSNYINHGFALDTRSDLGTLNMSDVPVAMVEVGNMRNAAEARVMRTVSGQVRYAEAVVAGIRRYLGR